MATGFYIGADGKARKIRGGYIGIDGKARKLKKGYIGDENGVARLCWTAFEGDPVFANNTWENIALACQLGAVPDTWNVGDEKEMTIDGWDYTVNIIGKNHDDYADGSGKAPLTFQLYNVYGEIFAMNSTDTNSGGWPKCNMRRAQLPAILLLLPPEVQASIKEVTKVTNKGGTSGGSTLETSTDKLFLLSETEILNTTNVTKVAEGTQYEYYANGASTRKNDGFIEQSWWTRTPDSASTSKFGYVINDHVAASYASYAYGLSFGFCF